MALARALIKRPQVLLLDEPLAALDKKLRAETQFELMELQRKLGTTFVIVTHDQDEAMTVADRIAVMDHGRAGAGRRTPAKIYEQPNSRWVADFVGEVTHRSKAGAVRAASLEARSGRLRTADRGTEPAETVLAALRPEKIGIGGEPAGGAIRTLAGTDVPSIGYRGDMSIYKVRLADRSLMKVSLANVSALVDAADHAGRTIWSGCLAAGRRRGADELTTHGRTGPAKLGAWARVWWHARCRYLWLAIFFLAPFVIVLKISLSQTVTGAAALRAGASILAGLGRLDGLRRAAVRSTISLLAADSLYLLSYLKSLQVAAISTVDPPRDRLSDRLRDGARPARLAALLVMLVILPFWTSFLIRVYAWIGILKRDGLLNDVLMRLRIDRRAAALSSDTAVYIGIVYSYLPFMVLPIYATLEKMDARCWKRRPISAVRRWKAFWLVTLPLSLPGVLAGALLCSSRSSASSSFPTCSAVRKR